MAYRVFTAAAGVVQEGAKVESFTLTTSGAQIPAILVGEPGRGRALGVLPVHLLPLSFQRWGSGEPVRITAASVSTTQTGKPKLIEAKQADASDKAIVVLPTPIGFRGGNEHTGDRQGEGFEVCPLEVLVRGVIAQGTAGHMGSGEQLVGLLPKGKVLRTGYTGRLYGRPSEHYYVWDGEKLLAATWEERELLAMLEVPESFFMFPVQETQKRA